MAVPEALVDSTVRHAVYLERLKSGEANQMVNFLQEVDREIRKKLLFRSELAAYKRDKLSRLLKEIDSLLTGLYAKQTAGLLGSLKELAEYEAGFEARNLNSVVSAASFAVPAITTVWSAATLDPMSVRGSQGGKLLDPFIKDWARSEVEAVKNRIRQGAFEGQTNAEIVRSIRGTKALRYKDGLLDTTRRHAEAIVRTAVQHVASTARKQTWDSNADLVTGYRWVSTLDSRTTTQCRSLDGQTFEVGDGPMPPLHIGCRSTTVAELDDGLDFLDKDATRSSVNGYVDADLTYYQWLKRQPAAFQDSAIGPTRGKLLRNGGINAERFAQLQLDRNFQPLTLNEMRALEPQAFERAGV
ncbi:MAG: phage head morphogenesis protein [Alcanivorax sp.]|uniref:minor capsid protein n=1 Tax=unclassified Alcanivorax TaxID=2638842 RepID=UPI000C8FEBC4|nr:MULTISPECIES: minor capsid protein [unclassified Alcanivorax]MAC14267.1 phage head morphogenesis protein [Alcanivorax sp.]